MSRQQANTIFNLLTLLFLGLTGLVGFVTVAIALDTIAPPVFRPENDAPPPTLFTAPEVAQGSESGLPTLTPSPTVTSPAPSPEPTYTPSSTPPLPVETVPALAQASPTRTPLPTRGAAGPSPTPTPTLTWTPSPTMTPPPLGPTPTATPVLPFIVQPGTPILRGNFANAEGCNWQGIAGSVVDNLGEPVLGVTVLITGETLGDRTVKSGTSTLYGSAGWEVVLGSTPDNSAYTITLMAEDGTRLAPFSSIVFPSACEQNLAVVNFVKIRPY